MNHTENAARNANSMATAAFIFALIAAVFAGLTYFMLPGLVQRGVENVEAMKVGGPEKYEQLKKIYMDNADVFGEQVDQIQAQIDMYKQMQTEMPTDGTDVEGTMGESTDSTMMPETDMMMTGDEAMAQ